MPEERRRRILTDEDIVAIGDRVSSLLPVCSLGLTSGDAAIIKRHLNVWKKATNIVGTIVLTAIVLFCVGIFSRGFWASLIEGVKK
jgi:CHASE2 domain-containing sensor protein